MYLFRTLWFGIKCVVVSERGYGSLSCSCDAETVAAEDYRACERTKGVLIRGPSLVTSQMNG